MQEGPGHAATDGEAAVAAAEQMAGMNTAFLTDLAWETLDRVK